VDGLLGRELSGVARRLRAEQRDGAEDLGFMVALQLLRELP